MGGGAGGECMRVEPTCWECMPGEWEGLVGRKTGWAGHGMGQSLLVAGQNGCSEGPDQIRNQQDEGRPDEGLPSTCA